MLGKLTSRYGAHENIPLIKHAEPKSGIKMYLTKFDIPVEARGHIKELRTVSPYEKRFNEK